MLGSRGIYHRGWKAVTFHPLGAMYDDGLDPDAPFDDDVWELYDVVADPSETNDLAAAEPERLAAMVDLWWEEAARNDVLPLDNRPLFAIMNPRPTTPPGPRRRTCTTRTARRCPSRSRSTCATARTRSPRRSTVPAGVVAEGTLLALGSVLGGFTLQLARRPAPLRAQPLRREPRRRRQRRRRRRPGAHRVAFVFTKTAEFTGRGELFVDGQRRRRRPTSRTSPR